MNHFKSLSDSSTSESEEDGRRLQHILSCDSRIPRKREISTDDTEDEHTDCFLSPKRAKSEFKNPAKYVERDLSDSESDDKASTLSATFRIAADMPTKDSLNDSYSVGMKMMERMGYKSGTGLGKFEQGRVDIVHASKQRGRRGLGLHIAGLEPSDTVWDPSEDQISAKESIEWMPMCQAKPFNISLLREWMQIGEKKLTIDDQTEFCDPDILKDVLAYKSVFDELEPEEMRKARTRSNPFETIRGGIFLNRAAMKMANMDAVFDFMFTTPRTIYGEHAVSPNELLYFADICAGPGGFSEYVLWRKKWESKGFGFTLKETNDFKLEDFLSGPPETFEPHYGAAKQDGDIYKPENLREFKKFVLANTDNKGVHFVMADGGFSVEGQENEQEILSKRLYLCQFLCALSILRVGGHFVCKLFDLFTPFSVGLVYLMYHAFEKVCIFKPNTSRPANSERYIVCKWLKEDTRDICDYMFEVNEILDKFSNTSCDNDITEVVSLDVLKSDEEFYEYICKSNNGLGTRQIVHLQKIKIFAQNVELHEERQNDLRKQCLALWNVPDKARQAPSRPEPDKKYKEIMRDNSKFLHAPPIVLDENSILKLKSVFEYYCVVCGETDTDKATLYLGLGRGNIYSLNMKNGKWSKIDATLELPADTLFLGELIPELKGEGRAQRKINCLHIIDAICLGGIDVRQKHFTERMQLAEKLAKAVSKPSKPEYMPLRVKKVFELRNIEEIFDRLALRLIKNNQVPRLCYDLNDGRHIVPTGLLILKTTKDPWIVAYSKGYQKPYFFNTKKNKSIFEPVDEANAEFKTTYSNRLLWKWIPGVHLIPDQEFDETKRHWIHGHTIRAFVQKNLNRLMGIVRSS